MARTKCVARYRSQGNYVPKPKSKARKAGPSSAKVDANSKDTNDPIIQVKARPGEVVLRDIRRYQRSTEHLLGALPFQRLVREITQNYTPPGTRQWHERMWYEGYRYTSTALEAIQDATEDYLVELLEDWLVSSRSDNRTDLTFG
ncbi:hypothetical protein CF335_g8115 [Tilletia laevis]|nr:hypothetical protein CF335_g8115 [Tilletia laevis]